MYDAKVKEQFVELRAQGKSFASIAESLGVSKPTLIEWSGEMNESVKNLRAINDEALLERLRMTKERKLSLLSRQLEAVENELDKRVLSDVPTDKLHSLLFRLIGEMRMQQKPLELQRTTSSSLLENLEIDTIASTAKWLG